MDTYQRYRDALSLVSLREQGSGKAQSEVGVLSLDSWWLLSLPGTKSTGYH